MKNVSFICLIIFLARVLDLFTTYTSNSNFKSQEQNFLVKIFNLNIIEFFVIEIILAFILILVFLFSVKKKEVFKIKADNFLIYYSFFFLKKEKVFLRDWLLMLSFKRIVVLFGSIIPTFIITTSILFSLNNFWVNLFMSKNQIAIKYYLLFNRFCFFDILIFIFPPLFLIFLLYKKLKKEYLVNNLSTLY